MALISTVAVMTVGGAEFTFEANNALSAMRSIANNAQIDAEGSANGNTGRVIIPFESINNAIPEVTTAEDAPVEDANCVTRTPEADSGSDEGGGHE